VPPTPTPARISTGLSIAIGVAIVIINAVIQVVGLPTTLVSVLSPLIVVLGATFGITPYATAGLIAAKLSGHVVAILMAVQASLSALMPQLTVGSVWRIVIAVALSVAAVLLPTTLVNVPIAFGDRAPDAEPPPA
jgi:hypothetical protein